jgi:hypothetical protein
MENIDRASLRILEETQPRLAEVLRALVAKGASPAEIRRRFKAAPPLIRGVLECSLVALLSE